MYTIDRNRGVHALIVTRNVRFGWCLCCCLTMGVRPDAAPPNGGSNPGTAGERCQKDDDVNRKGPSEIESLTIRAAIESSTPELRARDTSTSCGTRPLSFHSRFGLEERWGWAGLLSDGRSNAPSQ